MRRYVIGAAIVMAGIGSASAQTSTTTTTTTTIVGGDGTVYHTRTEAEAAMKKVTLCTQ